MQMKPVSRISYIQQSILYALCLCPVLSYSQYGKFKTFTVEDGLVMNWVRGFHEDRHGFIWIYTWDGLSRYEGTRFRNYVPGKELSHSLVNDIWEAENGDLYIALNDGNVDVIRDLQMVTVDVDYPVAINFFYKTEQGEVYAGTDGMGVCRLANGEYSTLIADEGENAVLDMRAKDDLLFLSTAHSLQVFRSNKNSDQPEFRKIEEWRGRPDQYNCIFISSKDRVLIGSEDGPEELVYNSQADQFNLIPLDILPAHWKSKKVFSIAEDRFGNIWYGTEHGLLSQSSDRKVTIYTSEDGLPSDKVHAVFVDRNDILWIGTERGVAQLNLLSAITYHPLPSPLTSILVAPDGSLHGVADFHMRFGIQGDKITTRDYPQQYICGLLLNDQGWYTVFDDRVEAEPHRISNLKDQSLSTSQTVLELAGHIFWPAMNAVHAYSINQGTMNTVFHHRVETLAAYDENTILLGTWNEGVFAARLSIDESVPRLHTLRNLTEGLNAEEVRSLLVTRKGDIWIGTRHSGLLRLRCDDGLQSCDVELYNTTNGMVSNWITYLAEDTRGHVWVGSVSGLIELIPDSGGYSVFPFWKAYGVFERIQQVVLHFDSSVLFVTPGGYGKVKPQKHERIKTDSTFITDVFVNNRHQYESGQRLILNHQQNNLQFEFASPAYLSASDPPFTWRLLGSQDTSWSVPLYSQALNFANQHPGHYTLQVAHFNWTGERGPAASYPFEIRPPYWRQTWFIILCIVAFLSLVYGLYRLRIRQMRRVQQIRDRIAADLHDEIGSSLTHVNILAEIGKQETNGEGRHAEILERIGQEAQSSAESLDDIIWSVKSRADVVEDVVVRMRQYVTELFGSSDTTFELRVTTEGDSTMNLEQRRDFYLIYKELLRNIHRHAAAGHVDITINIERQGIFLEVADDGKGFETHSPTQRNGLENIRQRAQRWKGAVQWDSKPGHGTKATLRMARA